MDYYCVRDCQSGHVVAEGFAKREAAKAIRNEKNAEHYSQDDLMGLRATDARPRFIVNRTPNHPQGDSWTDQSVKIYPSTKGKEKKAKKEEKPSDPDNSKKLFEKPKRARRKGKRS